jgi:hypothetical protein
MPADIASTYIHRKSLSSRINYAFKYNLSVMVYSLVRIPIKSELFVLPTDVLNRSTASSCVVRSSWSGEFFKKSMWPAHGRHTTLL